MTERQIIFECVVGSRLYGVATPESDYDYLGVFLPSTDDMFGLAHCPREWSQNVKLSEGAKNSSEDVDRKHYSLQRFFELLLSGQPAALEMLFAPLSLTKFYSPMWDEIVQSRRLFLSKRSLIPFLGFAKSQSFKSFTKAETLNLLRDLLTGFDEAGDWVNDKTVGELCGVQWDSPRPAKCVLFGQPVDFVNSDNGAPCIRIAGRKYDINGRATFLRESLHGLSMRYGTRVQAAAVDGQDFKSIYHCFRLLGEGRELLTDGKITLPRPAHEVEFLRAIRNKWLPEDCYERIDSGIVELENLADKSTLPDAPDRQLAEAMCRRMLTQHLLSR